MSKPQVLFLGDLNKELPEYKAFAEKYECIHHTLTTREQLIQDFGGRFSNIVGIYGAWLAFIPVGGLEGPLLEAAPKSLRVVSVCSVGHEHFNGKALRDRNIALTNVPLDEAAGPVADLVLFNALQAFRNFKPYNEVFTNSIHHTVESRTCLGKSAKFDTVTGKVDFSHVDRKAYAYGEYMASRPNMSPSGHHAVVVGFGLIGRCIGKKLSDLGMKITYVKRLPLSADEEAALGYKATYHESLAETYEFADLVVIACPATPSTKHLINATSIDAFAKPIRIINIGRGSIIDEQALVNGLESGKVVFAGLDVFEQEPNVHPGLLNRQDVYLTPHVGASTVENFDYAAASALHNIDDVLKGGNGKTPVN